MKMLRAVLLTTALIGIAAAFEVTKFDQIEAAKKSHDKKITIKNLHVPASKMLDLRNLQEGTVVEFAGRVTFGYAEWKGTLIQITGKKIKIEGKPGHVIDTEGQRWWDGKGGPAGKQKPSRVMEVHLDDSTINGLNFKNPPVACFVANNCHNVVITNINIDASEGDKKGAKNTDGIGVGRSQNVQVINAKIHNQDDCFICASGKDITIDKMECTGGHGFSIGTLGNGEVVQKIHIKNSKLIRTMVGIRIKTKLHFTGAVRDITYENIEFKDVQRYGIIVHGNYGPKGGPEGEPTPFPIENIILKNVRGTVQKGGTNIWIFLAAGAKNWKWEKVNVTGGQREEACKGIPPGLNGIRCGKK